MDLATMAQQRTSKRFNFETKSRDQSWQVTYMEKPYEIDLFLVKKKCSEG